MVKKLTAGIVLVTTTLLSIPVYAEPPQTPPQENQSAQRAQAAVPAEPTGPAASAGAAQSGASAELTGDEIDSLNLHYIKGLFKDTGKIAASPIHWDKKDWLKVGLVLGVTGSLLLVDSKVKDFAQSHQSHVASGFAAVGNDLGNGLYTLPAVGAFYAYGAIADDHKARETSLLALESFAISGLAVEGLKTMVGRHRPNSGDSSTTFDGPHFSTKNVSFCSGHTASAFSIATVFAEEYKDNPFVPPIAYGLATLTGLSRIYSNEHWASDAFFGGALGYFVAKALVRFHKDDKNKLLGKRLMLLPQVGRDMTGLTMKLDF